MATGIGDTLVAARRQQGVALSDAAAETRVRESYLAALEAEDFAALGGDVYVKGFLRSYARFLRLDPEPLIATYRAHYERQSDEIAPLAQRPVAPLPTERGPGWVVGAGVALILIVLLAIIGLVNGRDDPEQDELLGVPPPVTEAATMPPATQPAEGTEQATDPSDDPTEQLAADQVRLELDVNGGPSWMRVVVDGVTELEGEQPDGTTLTYTADDEITIRLGDPGVVDVTVNGRDMGKIGDAGVPVTKTYAAEDAA